MINNTVVNNENTNTKLVIMTTENNIVRQFILKYPNVNLRYPKLILDDKNQIRYSLKFFSKKGEYKYLYSYNHLRP